MINTNDILSTIDMIDQQHLDIRTITMGISLLDCADPYPKAACRKIYDKICRKAEKLVVTGEAIEREFGIPIVNKRISVTPMALVAASSETEDYVPFAVAMDEAAKACGVNFIGGFSALVQKGFTAADRKLIAAIPEALAVTELRLLLGERGLHEGGHQHGRGERRWAETVKAAAQRTRGPGRLRLRQAGGVLQRGGGQPLYGRCLPWRRRGGVRHQCGGLRPRRGVPRPPGRQGQALRCGG